MANNTQLWQQVANALNPEAISKQPVANAGHVDDQPENGKKATSKKGMGTTKLKNVNAFNVNKKYSVGAIDKARAKLG